VLERHRLARRVAEVGLERVAEAAVVVAVREQRRDDPFRGAVAKALHEPQAVEQARLTQQEALSSREVGAHRPLLRAMSPYARPLSLIVRSNVS